MKTNNDKVNLLEEVPKIIESLVQMESNIKKFMKQKDELTLSNIPPRPKLTVLLKELEQNTLTSIQNQIGIAQNQLNMIHLERLMSQSHLREFTIITPPDELSRLEQELQEIKEKYENMMKNFQTTC